MTFLMIWNLPRAKTRGKEEILMRIMSMISNGSDGKFVLILAVDVFRFEFIFRGVG